MPKPAEGIDAVGMLGNAWMIASWSASRVRAPTRRKMVFIAQRSNECDHIQAKLAMW